MTQRVSIAWNGAQGNGQTFQFLSPSSDGRFVAFCSIATNLVPGGTSGVGDIFVRDRESGTTELVSVDSAGVHGDNGSINPSISADGRYVAFASLASNLVPGDINGVQDLFVRDRVSGTTELVSVAMGGGSANGYSDFASISADGRYVAFKSTAQNLVTGDTHFNDDVFVRDRLSGTTVRVSVDSGGAQGNGYAGQQAMSISADGRYVSFTSSSTNLVAGDTNGWMDVFVHDLVTGTTERVSVDSSGAQGDNRSGYYGSAISSDGRYVVFASDATNLVAGDTNGVADVFVHDRTTGTTERVSLGSGGAQANITSGAYAVSISYDGRFVAFDSLAVLAPSDTNGVSDIYVRDRQSATTEHVSVALNGMGGNSSSGNSAISGDGRFVAFESFSSNLVSGDTNGVADDFIRDRSASGSTSFCDAGVGGVIACPCANAPSGPGRGCDNSSSTGGAVLTASGVAYLSMDSLVFTSTSEKPSATSIVMQGTALAANGLVFGQGVRCVGGTLKRLFTKTAAAGSITAPNFGAGDPTVSARSTALGDVISVGQSRFYLVYYRDPVVLGGCPALGSFNATQTLRVIWSL